MCFIDQLNDWEFDSVWNIPEVRVISIDYESRSLNVLVGQWRDDKIIYPDQYSQYIYRCVCLSRESITSDTSEETLIKLRTALKSNSQRKRSA